MHQTNPVFAGISLALIGSGLPLVLGTYVARWPKDPETLSGKSGLKGRLAGWVRDLIATLQQLQADIRTAWIPASFLQRRTIYRMPRSTWNRRSQAYYFWCAVRRHGFSVGANPARQDRSSR
jgi:hypothetical protein